MKRFSICFAVFAAMFFIVGCGSSNESVYDNVDTSDSESEESDLDDTNSQNDITDDSIPDNTDSQTDDTDTDFSNDSDDALSDNDSDSAHETEIGETREANCTGLPAKAHWNTVSSITQTWNGTDWEPSTEAIFSTTASETKCRFVCNENYSWNDSECVAETRTANCESLPENAVWNSAASITQTWDDENWFPSSTGTYNTNSSLSECRFKCVENYNWNGSQCVAATIQSDCTNLPENAVWNVASSITQTWSGSEWLPVLTAVYNETPSNSECFFKCAENYEWNESLCLAKTRKAYCIGLPGSATWNTVSKVTQTWNGSEWIPTTSAIFSETPSTTECRFKCKEHYSWNSSTLTCYADSQSAPCIELPDNAIWNTVSEITQTWNGLDWKPSAKGTYNESASSEECRFKCAADYHWEDPICLSNTRTNIECTDIPANAIWNSVSVIEQTWDGTAWSPTNISSFNILESFNECRFKCKEHYNWNESTLTCDAETQLSDCSEKPEKTVWNDNDMNGKFTQTWSGDEWMPISYTSIYSTTAGECRYKCDNTHFWHDSECVSPCDSDEQLCEEITNSTKICIATSWQNYFCECDSGYIWNESSCKELSPANICTGQTKCYNKEDEMSCPVSSSSGNFYGQDAQYALLGVCTPPNFTIQTIYGDEVVLDKNTGLEWQRIISESPLNWLSADSYCRNLTYAGGGWRLPTPNELLTIVDINRYNPAVDITFFPDTYIKYFWTSPTFAWYYDEKWYIDFTTGYPHSTGNEMKFSVRCVRGKTLPNANFIISSEEDDIIVTDTSTGLIWQKTYKRKNWQEALDYCENLTYAGFSDWRVPNKNELLSLVNYNKYKPATDFPDTPFGEYDNFISSSTNLKDTKTVWGVNFVFGFSHDVSKTRGSENDEYDSIVYVRCVRSGVQKEK